MRNPLTLEAFAEWCEKQPAEKEFDYIDPQRCACAQYADHIKFEGDWLLSMADKPGDFWGVMDTHALHLFKPRTFGALASRLRARQE